MSSRLDALEFVDRQQFWAHHRDLEMLLRTNHWLSKTILGWYNVEMLVLPPYDRPIVPIVHVPRRTDRSAENHIACLWCCRPLSSHITAV